MATHPPQAAKRGRPNQRIDRSSPIGRAIDDAGKTIMDVAQALGVDDQTIRRWISGEVKPQWGNLRAMAAYLHTTAAKLMGDAKLSKEEEEAMFEELGVVAGEDVVELVRRLLALPLVKRARAIGEMVAFLRDTKEMQ